MGSTRRRRPITGNRQEDPARRCHEERESHRPHVRPAGLRYPPGHQEIEIGLVKLYRVTGDPKYLALAKFFLDERGNPAGHKLYGEYAQDHTPVVDQGEAVGHSVRAAYMNTAMADVAALTGDARYVAALDRLWDDVVLRKLYLTGGIGATGAWEGFGPAYDLANSAYAETCASIANALWNFRMFLLKQARVYIDVYERAVYNAMLSGMSLKGDTFFYPNPLLSLGEHERSPSVARVRVLPEQPATVHAVDSEPRVCRVGRQGVREPVRAGAGAPRALRRRGPPRTADPLSVGR